MFKQLLGAASVATLMALGTLTYAQTYGQGSAGASTSGSTAAQPSGSTSTDVSGRAGAGGSVTTPSTSPSTPSTSGSVGASGSTSGSTSPSVSGSATGAAGATIGSPRCDSMTGSEKERCIREEGSASGSTGIRTPDAGSTGMGTDKPKQQ